MRNDNIKKTVWTGLFMALVVVATVVPIPVPITHGYVNAGDALVILSAFFLGPVWGAVAAGAGSALADVFLGFATYAPATLIIKALMALTAGFILRRAKEKNKFTFAVAGSIAAELIMICGYFAYDTLFFGWGALADIPGNAIQGIFGVAAGCALFLALKKIPYVRDNF